MKRIAVVFGTRPEIIKLAELIKMLKKKKGIETTLVYTGQHYDYNLCQIFMEELRLPRADINLGIGRGSDKEQVSRMAEKLHDFFCKRKFDVIVAEGDTNSVLAAALAAFYVKAKFAHVEAGLRSFDWRMPEEINRIIADNLSYYAFAPTKIAVKNLKKSSARRAGIFLTGNTIVEAVQKNLKKAKHSKILERLGLKQGQYAVLTAHRQEYVDKKDSLGEFVKALEKINTKIVFPMHPRSRKMLKKFRLLKKIRGMKNLLIIAPIGYFDFLQLASNSMFLLSDSGGIQEEASVYKKYVVVLRDSTERPEILGKFGVLTGYDAKKIVKAANRILQNSKKINKKLKRMKCPFGDGKASQRIAKILAAGT